MDGYLLGIDHGGSVSKVALFDTEGHEIAVTFRYVDLIQPSQGWSERDANQMWADTCEMIQEILRKSRINPSQILAVGCTGHGNGLYLVDEYGIPVRNAINSSDYRAQQYVDNWKTSGVDTLSLPLTTQCLWPGQPNALMAWLLDHERETVQKAKWIFMAKDYIRMKLTSQFFAEITDMSGTSLMNVVTGQYDNRVLKMFGLQQIQSMLPPLISSADLAGCITKEAALLTGLKEGTPVAGGMFDIDACGLASGIVDETQMSLVAGTWGNNQYISRTPLIDKELFMTSQYSIPGWYLMLEGSPTSVSNLEWFIKTFLSKEKEELGDRFFDWMDTQVASANTEASTVLFLPFLFGCNEGSNIKACFYGFEGNNSRSEMIRAVYEGIVFSHKHHVERLLKFRDKPEVIRCTGGATRSNVWMQIFADIIGIPMEIPEGTQLGALGAAMAAGVCTGVYRDFPEAVKNTVKIRKRFEPDLKELAKYEMKYLRYKKIIQQVKGIL
jgi:L-xylulokinase